MKRVLVLILAVAVGSGCTAARAQGSRVAMQPPATSARDPAVMASYVRQLPTGSRVRIGLSDGRVIRGILMNADADPIVVQRRTRIPESPLQIPIKDVRMVEIEKKNGKSVARAIAVGAAAGAGAALGLVLILAAIYAD